MKHFFRNNGLSIMMFGLFFVFLVGQSIAGLAHYNDEQQEHNQPTVSYGEYLRTSQFLESVAENWESEFLQMGAYIFLTTCLFQKGSAESKDPEGGEEEVDRDPQPKPDAPWPVRRGGLILKLYEHSLTIAFLLLFVVSFALHVVGSHGEYCEDQREHEVEEACPTLVEYLGSSQLWFESFQNWQSEFLAVGSIVVLSIYLRQKGSPESKPVDSAHSETGTT
jgi:hypothetical protein